MDEKIKGVLNLAKGSVFFPFTQPTVKSPTGKIIKGRMPAVDRVMKNMFGDKDRDGVKNVIDCEPNNPKKQDKQIYLHRLNRQQLQGQPQAFVNLDNEQDRERIYLANMAHYRDKDIPAIANLISHEEMHHLIKEEQGEQTSTQLDNISTPGVVSSRGKIINPQTSHIPVGSTEKQKEVITEETGIPWWATKNIRVVQAVDDKNRLIKKHYGW